MRTREILAIAAIVFGTAAIGTDIARADVKIGSSGDYIDGVAKHRYGRLNGNPITDVLLVNIETTMSWRRVADGDADADLRQWANALKGKGLRMVTWSHEPMSSKHTHWGTASSFIASWRHVVRVFNAQGATNVEWVWNATSHSFRIKPSASTYGAKWYPGDSWVDDVAGESFNRIGCGFDAPKSFAAQIREIFAFAKRHDKDMVVAEFAANRYPGRRQWLRDAKRYIAANRSAFRGAFYYNSTNHTEGCDWLLNPAEKDILRSFKAI